MYILGAVSCELKLEVQISRKKLSSELQIKRKSTFNNFSTKDILKRMRTMSGRLLIMLSIVACAFAFHSARVNPNGGLQRQAVFSHNPKQTPGGFANTDAGKKAIVGRTQLLIGQSDLIISLPIDGVSKEKVDFLRKELPKATKATVIKNALMRLAVKGSKFESLGEELKDEDMFLFIPEGEAKATYDGVKKWRQEVSRTDHKFDPKFASMIYPTKRIEYVAMSPSKKKLLTKITMGVKAILMTLGRFIKSVLFINKLGRFFNYIRIKLQKVRDVSDTPVTDGPQVESAEQHW